MEQENYAFLSRMGIGDSPQVLINGVPMKPEEMEADNFEESVVSQILRLTPALQKDVYHVSTRFNANEPSTFSTLIKWYNVLQL